MTQSPSPSPSQRLATEKYLTSYTEEEETPATIALPPVAKRSSLSIIPSAILCGLLGIVVAGTGTWYLSSNGKTNANPAADLFLWMTGSKLTWEQYQRQQRARGNQRLDEDEYDWQQQLLNDAYSRR